jgi:hypothetical protein
VAGEISDNETDNQTIDKPLGEILAHVDRAGGKDSDGAHGSFLIFLDHFGRFHFFVSAIRKNVETRREGGSAQGGAHLILFGELAVIALVIGQDHVKDRTGNENDDRGKQNGKPKNREGNHFQSPLRKVKSPGRKKPVRGYIGNAAAVK